MAKTHKVSGVVTLSFENVEFVDDGDLCLRDQAIDALKGEVPGNWINIEDIKIDAFDGRAAK